MNDKQKEKTVKDLMLGFEKDEILQSLDYEYFLSLSHTKADKNIVNAIGFCAFGQEICHTVISHLLQSANESFFDEMSTINKDYMDIIGMIFDNFKPQVDTSYLKYYKYGFKKALDDFINHAPYRIPKWEELKDIPE